MLSKTSIVKKSPKRASHIDKKTLDTPIPITPRKLRTYVIISKLKRLKRNSSTVLDEKPKWFHRKKGRNDFLDTSSEDDFVTPRSLKKARIKKAMFREAKELKQSSAYNSIVPINVKPALPIVNRCTTNIFQVTPINPEGQSVTPIKEMYKSEGIEMNTIDRLDSIMNHYNQAMYQINIAYNECRLLRSEIVASRESIPTLHQKSPEYFSDVTTDIHAEDISGPHEEMLRVPETEVDSFSTFSHRRTAV